MALRAQLVILLADPEEADAFELHDDEGERLPLLSVQGSKSVALPRIELHEGRCEAQQTASHGKTIVLFSGGEEVRRVDVTLVAGERNVIRP